MSPVVAVIDADIVHGQVPTIPLLDVESNTIAGQVLLTIVPVNPLQDTGISPLDVTEGRMMESAIASRNAILNIRATSSRRVLGRSDSLDNVTYQVSLFFGFICFLVQLVDVNKHCCYDYYPNKNKQ